MKNDGDYYLLSPCLFMTIFEILIAVIIKADNYNLKCNKKLYQSHPRNAYA